jgi:quercetin dioxygenase-like cupin family protein
MNIQSKNFLISAELETSSPSPGLTRKIMGYNNQIMMVHVKFAKGAIGYKHLHFHSQTTYVESGVFEVTINEKTQTLKAGDGFYIEPNVIHGAVCLEEGVLIDVFSPMREDFLT